MTQKFQLARQRLVTLGQGARVIANGVENVLVLPDGPVH